jgi:hypothetical protein
VQEPHRVKSALGTAILQEIQGTFRGAILIELHEFHLCTVLPTSDHTLQRPLAKVYV